MALWKFQNYWKKLKLAHWQKPLPNHWDDVASVLFIYYRFNKDEEEDPSEFEAELAMLDDIENEMKEEMDVPDEGGKGSAVSGKLFWTPSPDIWSYWRIYFIGPKSSRSDREKNWRIFNRNILTPIYSSLAYSSSSTYCRSWCCFLTKVCPFAMRY